MINFFGYNRAILPHDIKSLCVADIPWIVVEAIMPYSSEIFLKDEFERLRQSFHNDIKQDFVNGAIEGLSLDTESKESVCDQMINSFKPFDEWREYFSRLDINVIISEPPLSSGRYDLSAASKEIAQATNEIGRAVDDWIVRAVLDGSLAVYPRGSQLRYRPTKVNGHFEEAYWDDLNKLLETSTHDLNCQFPAPIENFDIKSHTQTNNGPFSNPPLLRQDEWFTLIEEMMDKYRKEHGEYPNFTQAWVTLREKPPIGYGVSSVTDRGGEVALLMDTKTLGKSAFKSRFDRWTTKIV